MPKRCVSDSSGNPFSFVGTRQKARSELVQEKKKIVTDSATFLFALVLVLEKEKARHNYFKNISNSCLVLSVATFRKLIG